MIEDIVGESIKEQFSKIHSNKEDIKDLGASVKIWVLSGIVGTVMAFAIPTMLLFYNAGKMAQQIEQHTDQIKEKK
jgi:hypothetical protein